MKIGEALDNLGIKGWSFKGDDPKTEEEFNKNFRKIMGKDTSGANILSSDPKDFGVTWEQVNKEKTKLENEEPLKLLRQERNSLLAESDWTVMPDSPLSESKQTEWKTYRQALRDITKTASPKLNEDGMLDMSSVTFPTKPS